MLISAFPIIYWKKYNIYVDNKIITISIDVITYSNILIK